MLIQFSIENHRSIKDSAVISFAASKDKSLESYLLHPDEKRALLPAIAIYGANAAGKSMLLLLASNPGVTLSKEDLFSAVWGRDSADTLKVVANTVSNLRRKMGGSQTYIRTVRGGYVFSAVSVTA